MKNAKLQIILTLVAATLGPSTMAKADTMYTSLAAWEAAVGTYTQTTSVGTEYSSVSSVTLADGTELTFGQSLKIEKIGDGWQTWCCGYTGQVVTNYSSLSETWGITPVSAFGMYIEPDSFQTYDITLSLSSGSTETESVEGDAGAQFFGWTGTDVTSFTISSTDDFAVGDFFSAKSASAVPEPKAVALLGTVLAVLAFGWRRKALA